MVDTHPVPDFDALYPNEEHKSLDEIEALTKKTVFVVGQGIFGGWRKAFRRQAEIIRG